MILLVNQNRKNKFSDILSTVISVQFISVTQSCLTLCDPMNCSTPSIAVHHQLPESTKTHAHWVSDAIQPSHPLSSPSPPTLNLSQHQGLFKWVSSASVAKVLDFQLQHQSFHWTPRTDLARNKYLRVNWSQSILSAYTSKVEFFLPKIHYSPKNILNTQGNIRLMKSQGKYPDLKGASVSSFGCPFSHIKQGM